MEKRRGIKVLLFLLAFVGCFSLLPQQLWAKSKEVTISQADVYLPDISVYMETADGKACGKDEVKAKISDTGVRKVRLDFSSYTTEQCSSLVTF